MFSKGSSTLTVEFWIVRCPGGEPVDVAIHHAEISRDEHGVMDLEVSCTLAVGFSNVFGRNLLATLLHVTGDVE